LKHVFLIAIFALYTRCPMKFRVNTRYANQANELLQAVLQTAASGTLFTQGSRNQIRLGQWDDRPLNVKAFKVPHLLNRIIYGYFRKSKARRSFEYAEILLQKGIGTPMPLAYVEQHGLMGLEKSFYASEHLHPDFTFRELVHQPNLPDHEIILRQFAHFCWELHRNGIEFKDHSPGNTLIKKVKPEVYDFYLVDLNRMAFHEQMSFELRMKNLSRLTPKKEMVSVISNAYAECSGEDPETIFQTLWKKTEAFQKRFYNKKKWKKRIGIR